MKKKRMNEKEYNEIKEEIERIKTEIEKLRKEKNLLINKVRWYEYTAEQKKESYKNGFCYQHFGKRKKDLTEEERKEYQRLQTNKSRRTIL